MLSHHLLQEAARGCCLLPANHGLDCWLRMPASKLPVIYLCFPPLPAGRNKKLGCNHVFHLHCLQRASHHLLRARVAVQHWRGVPRGL